MIGFSCTGKTSLGSSVFQDSRIIDSDDEILKWIKKNTHKRYDHIYEIYLSNGRDQAIKLIEKAEEALIAKWANDRRQLIISLGPGFPFRSGWQHLRAVSNVILFNRSPQGIYQSLKERRERVFKQCPEAKNFDNWDVGVMVDEHCNEYPQQVAVSKITRLIDDRKQYYMDNDVEINTDDWERAKIELRTIWESLKSSN